MKSEILIIGGGQAGCMVAIALRQKKFQGSISIITNEDYLPYQRPPLSKGFLTDEHSQKQLFIKSDTYFMQNKIKVIKKTLVKSINNKRKKIITSNGKEYAYQELVIATGSNLIKMKEASKQKNIYYLRTIDDAIKIKSVLSKKKKISIIGAGYIGLEIAASARKKKVEVSILEIGNRLMGRSVCSDTSDYLQKKHEQEGVNFIFNALVENIEDTKGKKRITYNKKSIIEADAIIIGIGIKPNVKLASDSGLECDDGIIVNEYGQTSVDNIFAAGDCTNHPSNIYNKNLRLESVQNAVDQAKAVASKITDTEKPYNQVPWFWSEQYDLKIQIAGISANFDNHIVKYNQAKEQFTVYYFQKNKIVAVDAINDQKAFMNGKKLIKLKREIPVEAIKNKKIIDDLII